MNNKAIIKKKNNSYLGVRIYAENLGFKLERVKEKNRNGKEYTKYFLYDNKGVLIANEIMPKTIREKLDLINIYKNMNN